jgi:membrane-associated protease RseP (regulator of RpoE activity)
LALIVGSPVAADERKSDEPFRLEVVESDRAFLGVTSARIRGEAGTRITFVVPGSAADRAGLQSGDVLVELNGEPINDARGLSAEIHALAPGDRVSLTVLRDGDEQVLDAELGNRGAKLRFEAEGDWLVWTPTFRGQVKNGTLVGNDVGDAGEIYLCQGHECRYSGEPLWYRSDCVDQGCRTYSVDWSGRPLLGVQVSGTTADLRLHLGGDEDAGLLVSRVYERSPAEQGGVEVGDLILAVDGQPVLTTKQVGEALRDKQGRSVELAVVRDGESMELHVDLPRFDLQSTRRR